MLAGNNMGRLLCKGQGARSQAQGRQRPHGKKYSPAVPDQDDHSMTSDSNEAGGNAQISRQV